MNLLTTGDGELDRVLGGGLRSGSLIVLAGPPGSGKTILAQQVCFANATAERRAIYYTTWSEPHDKLVAHLEPFDFFDPEALGERVEFLHLADLIGGEETGALDAAMEEILRKSFQTKRAVVVIDSSKALHDVVAENELRRAIYDLASKVAQSDALLLLVGEYTPEEVRSGSEFAVADGIVQLENEAHGPVDRRWLRVLKMRGAEIVQGQHSFELGRGGFAVFPRLESTLPAQLPTIDGRAAFGLETLDALLGGGVPRGDVTLLAGPSGVGKTFLSLHFTAAGLARGERCLYISFQESSRQLLRKAAALGLTRAEIDRLVIRDIPPVEINLDEVGAMLRAEVAGGDVKRVVVDSLAELAFAARETERLPAYLWALGGFVRAAGGTTIFTNEMDILGSDRGVGGFSFLFGNVVLLRYIELDSGLSRGLHVLKMRESNHDRDLVEFAIGDRGVSIGEPVDGVTGLLGWSALRSEIDGE